MEQNHLRVIEFLVWVVAGTGLVCAVVQIIEHDVRIICRCCEKLCTAISRIIRRLK